MCPNEPDYDTEKYVRIPHQEISAEALRGLVEAFVLREGTDYGEQEFNLEQKVQHVYLQLERGEVGVVFNVELQSADMLTQAEIDRLSRQFAIQS